MPLYAYRCRRCGPFDSWKSMSRSTEPVPCPTCRRRSPRTITAPALNLMSSASRMAHHRNEKSADSPDVVKVVRGEDGRQGDDGHRHSHGHAHDHSPGHAGRGRRPWMVGH